ncbi:MULTISPECIES: aminodeoxychorismate lyase [Microbacterium]|uniref:aminodeoxychorismate lyase n=1 Tax=Microbacterium TaxID=33882 RepID=UPI00217DEF4E|nr:MULTISPECIES: aminodeoxychorismate lyase [Microbacterium]UWF77081.1 aminodeoxychorismate lyase [Microbacterium neungamense]WCM55241.1 aminodeoxychorismate lyase [Microbacterium sp. EF45047]
MAARFALMITPADAADDRADFSDTFTEVDPSAPALSVGELSTQRGDGVFESIGVIDRHAQEVEPHVQRLAHSAKLCDLPAPNLEQWRQAVQRAASACPPGEAVIKLILSRGVEHGPAPTAWATAAPAPDFSAVRRDGVRVVTLDRGYDLGAAERAPWLLLGAKTLSYAVNMAALREARRRGADDAVFVTSDGYVLEAPTASLIIRTGDRFLTPAPSGGILHGTTQLSVYEWLEKQGFQAEYATLTASDLAKADAAWLVSSIRLAAPITAVDGAPLPTDPDLTASLNAYLLSPR